MPVKQPSRVELEPIETASRDELTALQLKRLKQTLAHAYDRVPHYRRKFDATVIPMSGGMTERQVQLIADFKPDIIMVTPSYMLAIAEEMERQGFDPRLSSLKIGIFGSEPWTPAMRTAIETKVDMDAIDIFGPSGIIL